MADIEIWGPSVSLITTPAATDRAVFATGPGAGGYSVRGSFVWKDVTGKFRMDGDLYASGAEVPRLQLERATVLNWYVGGSGTPGDNRFTLTLNANPPAFAIDTAGHVAIRSAGEAMKIETTTARGSGDNFVGLYDPTGIAAAIGFSEGNNNLSFQNVLNGDIVFRTNNVLRWHIGAAGGFYPAADNSYAIGGASNRPTVLWAVSGTISTSDERQKTWRGGMLPTELSAAKRIAAELGFYQWNDAIAEKGPEGARLHFGVRAQQVWAIMADEGLIDPLAEGVAPDSKYAFLCWDEWGAIAPVDAAEEVRDDDDNVVVHAKPAQPGRDAGTRFGIRADQLALFLIAAQEARLAALEAA